jgi:hypothetical protein
MPADSPEPTPSTPRGMDKLDEPLSLLKLNSEDLSINKQEAGCYYLLSLGSSKVFQIRVLSSCCFNKKS